MFGCLDTCLPMFRVVLQVIVYLIDIMTPIFHYLFDIFD